MNTNPAGPREALLAKLKTYPKIAKGQALEDLSLVKTDEFKCPRGPKAHWKAEKVG